MVKKIKNPNKHEKEQEHPCTKDHNKEYAKKHEKSGFPRRIWPTDSEKKKGPKI